MKFARTPVGQALQRVGRHSLPVFAVGSLLSAIGQAASTALGGIAPRLGESLEIGIHTRLHRRLCSRWRDIWNAEHCLVATGSGAVAGYGAHRAGSLRARRDRRWLDRGARRGVRSRLSGGGARPSSPRMAPRNCWPVARERRTPLRILAIGSSSTLGVGASAPNNAYPAQLAVDLSSQWGIADRSAQRRRRRRGEFGHARAVARRIGERPARPRHMAGRHQRRGRGRGRRRLSRQPRSRRRRRARRRVAIILVDPQFYFGIKDLTRFEQFVAIVGDVGARMHVPVFSRFAMMKAWGAKSRPR